MEPSSKRVAEQQVEVPLDRARAATDTSLRRERERADSRVREELVVPEERVDQSREQTRASVDESLSQEHEAAREQIRNEVSATAGAAAASVAPRAPTGATPDAGARGAVEQVAKTASSSAEAAVKELASETEQHLKRERRQADDLTLREREDKKRAFLGILQHERAGTDTALAGERRRSDDLVSSRDEVLALISHDLRNLIQALKWKADLLTSAVEDDPLLAKRLSQDIEKTCDVMERWSTDLVDLASLDAGSLSLQTSECDASDLVNEAVQLFVAKAAKKGIRIAAEVPRERLMLRCDRSRVAQVLINLLDNATKFTPSGGTVTARVDSTSEGARFSVQDSGRGIAPADQPRVFEKRWHTGRGRGGGAGLGLYIAKRVVESHGGRIWVESAPEEGATFRFLIPYLLRVT